MRVTRPDGAEVTVTAEHAQKLTTDELRSVVAQLAVTLDGASAGE